MPDHEYPEGFGPGSIYSYDDDVAINPYLAEAGEALDDAGDAAADTADAVSEKAEAAADAAAAATTAVADAIAETGEEIAEDAGNAADQAERSVGNAVDEVPAEPAPGTTTTTTATATDTATGETVTTSVMVEVTDSDRVEASSLIGADVQTTTGESIGSIDEIVLGGNGEVEGVVIDVGGFLGMGSDPVLLSWNDLTLQRDGDSVVAVTSMTAEQLEALTSYERSSLD